MKFKTLFVFIFIIFTVLLFLGCPEPASTDSDIEDSDGDGIEDWEDNCEGHDDNIDADQDGNPNGCDECEGHDDYIDTDEDSIPDGCDNCPYNTNDQQLDADGDGIGDACETPEAVGVCDGVVHNSSDISINICVWTNGGSNVDFALSTLAGTIAEETGVALDTDNNACVEFKVDETGSYWWVITSNGEFVSSGKIVVDANNQDCTYTETHDSDL